MVKLTTLTKPGLQYLYLGSHCHCHCPAKMHRWSWLLAESLSLFSFLKLFFLNILGSSQFKAVGVWSLGRLGIPLNFCHLYLRSTICNVLNFTLTIVLIFSEKPPLHQTRYSFLDETGNVGIFLEMVICLWNGRCCYSIREMWSYGVIICIHSLSACGSSIMLIIYLCK